MANSVKKSTWTGSQTLTRLKALDTSKIKPCSQEADFKMVAAAMTINTLSPSGFEKIHNSWATALLQEGFLFKEKSSNKIFLSMQCNSGAAWGFETEKDAYAGKPDIFLLAHRTICEKQAISRVREMVVTEISAPVEHIDHCCEQYVAIPTRISSYLS